MTIQKLMQNRYSVRSYSQMPLQPEHLAQILNAGRAAPTAANRQPQRVLVVRSEDGAEKEVRSGEVSVRGMYDDVE